MILAALPIIGSFLGKAADIVDKLIPDKDLAEKLKNDLQAQALQQDYSMIEKEIDARAQLIGAEIQSQGWMARNWRPILMLTIVGIVANNYLVYPYLSMFTAKALVLELPDKLWNLMSIGVGGYVVGRTGEKMVETWKKS